MEKFFSCHLQSHCGKTTPSPVSLLHIPQFSGSSSIVKIFLLFVKEAKSFLLLTELVSTCWVVRTGPLVSGSLTMAPQLFPDLRLRSRDNLFETWTQRRKHFSSIITLEVFQKHFQNTLL